LCILSPVLTIVTIAESLHTPSIPSPLSVHAAKAGLRIDLPSDQPQSQSWMRKQNGGGVEMLVVRKKHVWLRKSLQNWWKTRKCKDRSAASNVVRQSKRRWMHQLSSKKRKHSVASKDVLRNWLRWKQQLRLKKKKHNVANKDVLRNWLRWKQRLRSRKRKCSVASNDVLRK
jgi:hypothetical protein